MKRLKKMRLEWRNQFYLLIIKYFNEQEVILRNKLPGILWLRQHLMQLEEEEACNFGLLSVEKAGTLVFVN